MALPLGGRQVKPWNFRLLPSGVRAAASYCEPVELWLLLLVAALGAVVGAALAMVWFKGSQSGRGASTTATDQASEVGTNGAAAEVPLAQLMSVLPGASLAVDGVSGAVERASQRAVSLGLVTANRIAVPELDELVRRVMADGATRERDFLLRRSPRDAAPLHLRARAGTLNSTTVLVFVEDVTGVRRVDTVRRDFVANVSHELKTPVGALLLLSEALSDASEDPKAVRRFSDRITAECERLTRLIADLIDLSRLQSDDPLQEAREVAIDDLIGEAVDTVRTAAAGQQISVVVGGTRGLSVYGVEDQLVTALRNLLANAIAYSQPKTQVAVGVAAADGTVSISVKDQGIGIANGEIDRIFERFYRVDPARSRVTGGTGLGLSLVKHICQNHGGEVTVWSVPGEGSTFTLRLPQFLAGLEAARSDQGAPQTRAVTPGARDGDPSMRPAQSGGGES